MGTERLTAEELSIWNKLTTQKKSLKEKQQVEYNRLKQKQCECLCHVMDVLDCHWFESCC